MNHLSRFLVPSKRAKDMDRKKKPRTPKLERRNAVKNIEYDAASSSSSLDDSSASLHTRSLDIPDRTSFRIEGSEGELDRIYQSLGLSGPEDFAIPATAWEAMKLRTNSDILPITTALDVIDVSRPAEVKMKKMSDPIVKVVDEFEERVSIRVSDEPAETSGCCAPNTGVCVSSVGVGIKGARPPLLKPPPSMRLPLIDSAGSTWDLVRDLAPQVETWSLELKDEETGRRVSMDNRHNVVEAPVLVREVDDETPLKRVEDDSIGRVEGNVILSESYSFTTTSNDDDSSSTTTEPLSTISPNGRFRRVITDWQKGELLGRGSFGSVYEGISDDGFFFAVKEVSLLDQGSQGRQSISQLEQEIALLSQFEHENIVQYYGTAKDGSTLYIFLELVTIGSLANLYRTYKLRDSQVSAYTRQILHGLKYLHDRDVVHRDIKCANLLVHANGSVKLADFGLAKATKLNDVKSCKGTAFWMAPEVVRGKNSGYGLPADIWSLGCTVLEMLTGLIPYAPLEWMQALYRIGKGEPPPIPDSLSADARDFVLQCIQVNPDDRPTACDLLNHSFVRRPLNTSSGSGSASPYHTGRRVNVSP